MSKQTIKLYLILISQLLALFSQTAYSAITSLPVTPAIGMATIGFGTGQAYEHIYSYITPSGGLNGAVQNFNVPVYYADPTPGDKDLTNVCGNGVPCEKLGNLSFQNVLWDGAGQPISSKNLSGGAITLGGFNLTDTAEGGNYAFLQIYSDNANPNGVIDSGNYYGKVNYDIPGYNNSPFGWSYTNTQYNFLDIPYDVVNASQGKVSFETALVQYTANTVNIIADFTWNYTTGYSLNNCSGSGATSACFGVVGGSQLTQQSSVSQNLLNLYSTQYNTVTYNNLVTTPVPIPACPWLFAFVIGFFAWFRRLQIRR